MIDPAWKNQTFVKLSKPQLRALLMLLDNLSVPLLDDKQDAALVSTLKESLNTLQQKKSPTVFDRIDELDFSGNASLNDRNCYKYEWVRQNDAGAGYEKLDSENLICGGHHYSGVYHPNVICETGHENNEPGICIHCGCTLF